MAFHPPLHPIERAAVAIAGASLGAATAFATVKLAPLAELPLIGTGFVAGIAVAAAGLFLLQRVGMGVAAVAVLEPISLAEVIAEQVGGENDELLLDDPIIVKSPSRVVRLFTPEQPPEPLPEPGELVTRIATYLDSGRGGRQPEVAAMPHRVDASAALHAALADIRRSLG